MKKNAAVVEVRVSLKEGLTILDLKPGNATTVAELRQIIKNNGFVSKEATGVARGAPNASADRQFTVSGTTEELTLSEAPKRIGDAWQLQIRAPTNLYPGDECSLTNVGNRRFRVVCRRRYPALRDVKIWRDRERSSSSLRRSAAQRS